MNSMTRPEPDSESPMDSYARSVFRVLLAVAIIAFSGAFFVLLLWFIVIDHLATMIVLFPLLIGCIFTFHRAVDSLRRSPQEIGFSRRGVEVHHGARVREALWMDVRSIDEVESPWGGRRFLIGSSLLVPLVLDTSLLSSLESLRFIDRLRQRVRPLFFRRVDWILSDGASFVTRGGPQVRSLAEGFVWLSAGWLGSTFISPAIVAVIVAIRLTELTLRATTVVRIVERGLERRHLFSAVQLKPGSIREVRYRSQIQFTGASQRWVEVRSDRLRLRLDVTLREFEALAAAIEGLERDTPPVEGVYFPEPRSSE